MEPSRSITVLQYQGIGDAILTLPLLHWFRGQAKGYRLQVVTPRMRFGLFSLLADSMLGFVEAERQPERIDGFVLDLDTGLQNPRYRALVGRLRCERLLGFRCGTGGPPTAGECLRLEITETPMWRQYIGLGRLLLTCDEPVRLRPPLVEVPQALRERVRRLLEPLAGRRLLACAPGASIEEKRWPASHFAELLGALHRSHDVAVVLLGSEDERPLGAAVTREVPLSSVFDGFGLGLVETAAVLERCAAAVGNDSAMLHLAAVMGTPVVGIYGRYCSPQTHRPFGASFTLLYEKGGLPAEVPAAMATPYLARYLDRRRDDPWVATGRVVMR